MKKEPEILRQQKLKRDDPPEARLFAAVVKQAYKDLVKAYSRLAVNPEDKDALADKKECEAYFLEAMPFSHIDGTAIIKQAKRSAKGEAESPRIDDPAFVDM